MPKATLMSRSWEVLDTENWCKVVMDFFHNWLLVNRNQFYRLSKDYSALIEQRNVGANLSLAPSTPEHRPGFSVSTELLRVLWLALWMDRSVYFWWVLATDCILASVAVASPTTPLIGGFPTMYFILFFRINLQHTPTDCVHNSLVSISRSTPTTIERKGRLVVGRPGMKRRRRQSYLAMSRQAVQIAIQPLPQHLRCCKLIVRPSVIHTWHFALIASDHAVASVWLINGPRAFGLSRIFQLLVSHFPTRFPALNLITGYPVAI